MIFFNESQKVWGDMGNVLFRIGQWCATNCYNCHSAEDEKEFYAYEDFFESFWFVQKNCHPLLHVFFYGVEGIFHPEIHKFVGDPFLENFKKSVHISPVFSVPRMQKIFELHKKFPELSFDTCYTIKDEISLKWVLLYLQYVIEKDILSTLDIFFDYQKYWPVVIKFLQKFQGKFSDKSMNTHMGNNTCVEFQFHDARQVILLYDLKKQEIINNEITNVPYPFCVVRHSLGFFPDKITVSEEIEFTKDGDITIHINNYCSKGIQKISHIKKDHDEILRDFETLKNYLEKYDTPEMGKNCYDCMTHPYFVKS